MLYKQIPGVSEFLDPTPGDNTTWRLSRGHWSAVSKDLQIFGGLPNLGVMPA